MLKGKERILEMSRSARQCAVYSAGLARLDARAFKKNGTGIPVPFNGVYWSVSHKPDVAAGIVSQNPVGIDIEKIKPVSEGLFERIVRKNEVDLFSREQRAVLFFKVFTAKESVLKITGAGLKGLFKTKVVAVQEPCDICIRFENRNFWVENYAFDHYLASVTKNNDDVQWTVK